MTSLDLAFTRKQFPAFTEPTLDGWAFFENAAGSYPCRQVIDRLVRFYQSTKVQPYSPYPASEAAGLAMDESYERLAPCFNVAPDEVHFGPSTSQNTYVLAQAMRAGWRPGDEVVVTNQDHEANSGVWRRLAESGITVKEWRVDPGTGELDPDQLRHLLGPRTRVVAFPHCSNIIGHINPVRSIVDLIHQVDAIAVVDGVAYAPHGFPDVADLGADIYLCSLYKTYGPHLGLMVVRRRILDQLANQSHYFNADEPRKKLVPAGPDHAQIAAAAGIADYYDALHDHHFDAQPDARIRARRVHDLLRTQECHTLGPLLDWLRARSDLRIVGPTDPVRRAPTVSVVPLHRRMADVVRKLVEHRIMINRGDFYAIRPLEALGLSGTTGVLRMSFVHYTSPAEIEQLINAMDISLSS